MQGQHWQISLQPCWCINAVISDAVWMREPLSEAESFWYQRGKWFSADHYTHWPVISSTSCEAASELSPWFIIYFSLVPGSASRAAWSSAEELFWVQLDTWRKQCEIMALPGSPLMLSTQLLPLQWKRSGMSQDTLLARMDGFAICVFSAKAFTGAISRLCSPVFRREDWLWSSWSSIASCIWASLSSLARIRPFPTCCR